MQVDIIPIERPQKPVLRQMMEFYCYDFSEMLDLEVSEHGWYGYKYLDLYWLEEDRHPFFVKVDGNYAGFVLISKTFKILTDPDGHTIAEFFILRKYRKKGIGSEVAKRMFDQYSGSWEVSVVKKNVPALQFWEKVIQEYSSGKVKTHVFTPKENPRQVYLFGSNKGD
ncbi:MAG: GNAT family N-acetyltransferase [Bacteroidota bacterium]